MHNHLPFVFCLYPSMNKTIHILIDFSSSIFQVAFSILVIQSTVAWAIPEHKEKRSLAGSFPFAAHHQHSQGTVFKTENKL